MYLCKRRIVLYLVLRQSLSPNTHLLLNLDKHLTIFCIHTHTQVHRSHLCTNDTVCGLQAPVAKVLEYAVVSVLLAVLCSVTKVQKSAGHYTYCSFTEVLFGNIHGDVSTH